MTKYSITQSLAQHEIAQKSLKAAQTKLLNDGFTYCHLTDTWSKNVAAPKHNPFIMKDHLKCKKAN